MAGAMLESPCANTFIGMQTDPIQGTNCTHLRAQSIDDESELAAFVYGCRLVEMPVFRLPLKDGKGPSKVDILRRVCGAFAVCCRGIFVGTFCDPTVHFCTFFRFKIRTPSLRNGQN
jgi:hypothetical protein